MFVADKATVWCCSNDATCVGKTGSVFKELVINEILYHNYAGEEVLTLNL